MLLLYEIEPLCVPVRTVPAGKERRLLGGLKYRLNEWRFSYCIHKGRGIGFMKWDSHYTGLDLALDP